MVTKLHTILSIVVCLAMSVVVTGCRDHDYADKINLDAGDAIARNKAIQTIDPWPRRAFKKRQVTNGQRVVNGYDQYEGATAEPANER